MVRERRKPGVERPQTQSKSRRAAPAAKTSWSRRVVEFGQRVELPRKAYHASNGLIVLAAWVFQVAGETALRHVARYLVFSLCVEALRLGLWPQFNRLVGRVLAPFMRPKESHSLSGNTWFLLGVTLVLYCFPLDIASVSIVLLAFCDPFASLVGMTVGRRYPIYRFASNKTVCGLLGGIAMGIASVYCFYAFAAPLRWHDVSFADSSGRALILHPALLALLGGTAAGVSETLIHIPGVDDNFVLPLASASFLYSLELLLQRLP